MEPKGTVIVTGANGGLGNAIVAKLASTAGLAGYYGVYTVRSPAAPAVRATLASAPLHDYDILPLDLTRLTDVRTFAAALNARVAAGELPRIRALILNAAFQEYTTQTWTDDGFDTSFAANYLGHWLLTLLLLQSMDPHEGRIVVLGSLSHDPSAPFNKMAFKDPKWRTFFPDGSGTVAIAKGTWSTTQDDPEWSGGLRRYAASKLCQIMMIPALQRRLSSSPLLKNISILGVDPGTLSNTTLLRRGPWFMHFFVFRFFMHLAAIIGDWLAENSPLRTAGKSAGDVARAAFGEFGEERPDGWYFDGSKKAEMSAEARDEQKQEMLWRETVGYVRLEEGETILGDWK
ncbi:putative short-chain dehydrogenase [Mycena albidolilacea]|uniref:3beta-hydroxysteroid 3-dehydrogenase n=1 Tax=Mycena albidolilacea TaxID=1033008 RepID=A0AAD7AJI7_9AGAR|nr:putative short-chain dehydrogenase [Mycena albidolilacea]